MINRIISESFDSENPHNLPGSASSGLDRSATQLTLGPAEAVTTKPAICDWADRLSEFGVDAACQGVALQLASYANRHGGCFPAVATLEDLVTNATSEAVRLGAANLLVDRAVGKATERIHVAASIVVKRPWWRPPPPPYIGLQCRSQPQPDSPITAQPRGDNGRNESDTKHACRETSRTGGSARRH